MCEIGKTNSNGEEDDSIFNLYDYMNNKKSSLLENSYSEDMKQDGNFGVEREIYSTSLDNIEEEQILVQKLVEYYVPATLDYKFSKMFDAAPKPIEFTRSKGDTPELSRSPTSMGFSNNRKYSDHSRCEFFGSSTSKHSLKLIRSKSVTQLKSSYPECLKTETPSDQTGKKYSKTFLNSELALQELNQQNILAQELLEKYFKKDLAQSKTEESAKHNTEFNVGKKGGDKSMHTVSSLLKRYYTHNDQNEQVCIKPSDEYIFLNDKTKKDLSTKSASLKFVRPFKYHKEHWDSGSNFDVMLPFQFQKPRKRTRRQFESNVALKQDSSTDTSLKTENVQFLAAESKRSRKSDSQQNKILFKTDSKNFENTCSYEELQAFMPERYMDLRNLYGCNYIENMQEQVINRPRYNFQTLPNNNSKSAELVVKFFDSGSHIKVTDDDYKKWLKEKDFIKYTDFTNSSVSSITFRSISQKIVNYSVAPFSKANNRKRSRPSIIDKSHQIGFNKLTDSRTRPSFTTSLDNYKFVDIEYSNLYQLFLYEHIVVSNVINFYCSFNATRIRKLTVLDRVYQLMFLLFCYYILSTINNKVFNQHVMENWF